MARVKITVLKTDHYPELAEEYLTDGDPGPCPEHQVGDVYYYEGGAEKPEGLCPWAWLELYRAVSAVADQAKNEWYKPGARVQCCTDAVRPVTFELRLEQGPETAPDL